MLRKEDVEEFTLGIEHGCFYWKIKLKEDDEIYQIKYKIEEHITPAGNKSKRRKYFIKKNGKNLFFDENVRKWFNAFRLQYKSGI